MDTGSFIAYIKLEDIFKDIAEDAVARFYISNYELIDHYLKEKTKE